MPKKQSIQAAKPATKSKKSSALTPKRVADILARLDKKYPKVRCALHHKNAWQLLIATILSAQCTDVRVNLVTPELFKKFPTPAAMGKASIEELEALVRTTGFFRNKAKNIRGASQKIVTEFSGKVPADLDQLLTLPGVARKTANVVLGSWYGISVGIVVDTHVARISHRLGLTHSTAPQRIEQDLMKIIPPDHWIDFSHQIIHFGREICVARKPRCASCPLETLCASPDKTWSSH